MTIWNNTRNHTVETLRLGFAIVAMMVIATACGSGDGDPAAQVAGAAESAADATTASSAPPTTGEENGPATVDAIDDESSGAAIVIEGEITFGERFATGTWEATKGADVLGCSGGSLYERGAEDHIANRMTCENGDKAGSFVGRFAPAGTGATSTSSWELILTDGDFADMSGTGRWEGTSRGDSADIVIEMDVEFGAFAEPLSSLNRLVDYTETDCWDGFVTDDGLAEYATVDDTMYRLDLVTGEETTHGEPPAGCAWWIGDSELGRRVAFSLPEGPDALPDGEHKIYFGSYDGEWDTEVTYDEVTFLVNRSIGANRLLLSQPHSGRVFILDATTGEAVGESFDGAFGSGRHSVAAATSSDGQLIAFGGSDVETEGGQLFIVDTASGDELARIALDVPVSAVAFDIDGDAVIAGLATGGIVTIDVDSSEVTSSVAIEPAALVDSLGVRPDGLVVVATASGAHLVDRETGPTGDGISVKHSGASRIRPDGKINSLTNIQIFEVYEIES